MRMFLQGWLTPYHQYKTGLQQGLNYQRNPDIISYCFFNLFFFYCKCNEHHKQNPINFHCVGVAANRFCTTWRNKIIRLNMSVL